ncbi:MAG TPA: hypothetical protein VM760_05130 [Sphingomicrobium sp.]|jgi:hypothetical protein|nr:hypothetical protein [Sphingomicrobium sp.]
MIAATLLFLVATPTDVAAAATAQVDPSAPVTTVAKPPKNTTKSCREMLLSSSRLGTIKVCKTRAEWRRWDDCHRSVTRYCTPEKKNERLYSEWKHDRIVCKDIKETGSRLSTQRVCSTAREWRLAEEEAQKAIKDRQNMSTLTNELGDGGNFTRPQ